MINIINILDLMLREALYKWTNTIQYSINLTVWQYTPIFFTVQRVMFQET